MRIKGKIGNFFHIISIDKEDKIQIRKCPDMSEISEKEFDRIVYEFKTNPEWGDEGAFEKIAAQRFKCIAIVCLNSVQVMRIIYGSITPKLIAVLENIDKFEIGEFCIASAPQNIYLVQEYIQAFESQNQIDSLFQGKIELAITEAVQNAIFHGNKCDVNKKVTITLNLKEDVLIASIKDEGQGFNFESSCNDPTRPDTILKETGRGLYLMRVLSDKLILEDNGSTIILIFDLKP